MTAESLNFLVLGDRNSRQHRQGSIPGVQPESDSPASRGTRRHTEVKFAAVWDGNAQVLARHDTLRDLNFQCHALIVMASRRRLGRNWSRCMSGGRRSCGSGTARRTLLRGLLHDNCWCLSPWLLLLLLLTILLWALAVRLARGGLLRDGGCPLLLLMILRPGLGLSLRLAGILEGRARGSRGWLGIHLLWIEVHGEPLWICGEEGEYQICPRPSLCCWL